MHTRIPTFVGFAKTPWNKGRAGKKARSIRPICCLSPCPKRAACCGIWSGLGRLTPRLLALGHTGAAGTSSEPGKATGNDEPPETRL
jgi:hypothetical protein